MTDNREAREVIADAIERADIGYRMELTRLVDGESTYRLTYSDGQTFEFSDTDEVYAHVRATKRAAQADAILAALPADERLREAVTALERIASLRLHSRDDDGENADWMEREAHNALARIKDVSHAD